MKVDTKFNINDLVSRKFDTSIEDTVKVLEIMEIQAQICYGGQQIWYLCKPLVAIKRTTGYGTDKKSEWEIGHGIGKDDNSTGWHKYREDELIETDERSINIISNGKE